MDRPSRDTIVNNAPGPAPGHHQLRAQHLLGWAALALMAWFAIHFAAERLYADGAYFLIQVVKEGDFHILNGRWLIPLIQWLPVLGVQLGIPLDGVIVLYSLGNVVIALFAFLFLTRVLKDPDSGTMLVATQFVGLSQALFCPIFEFYFGAMLLVVFLAVLRTERLGSLWRGFLLAVLFVLVISSHFMGLLAMLLVLALHRIWEDRRLMAGLAVLLLLQQVHRFSTLSVYESAAFSNVLVRLEHWGVLWLFAPGRLLRHAAHGLHHYPDTLLLSVVAVAVLIRRKDTWALFVLLAGLLGLYVLLGLFFPDATHDRYREILDYTPTAWVLFVLGSRVIGIPGMRPVVIGALSLILVYRMAWSTHVAEAYTARVAWMTERIRSAREQGIRRGIDLERQTFVPHGHQPSALDKLNPSEVLLLSARDGPDRVVVLVPLAADELRPDLTPWLDRHLQDHGTEFPNPGESPYFEMPQEEFQVMH